MSKSSSLYKKLLPGGLLDTSPIVQDDHDALVLYMKSAFSKVTNIQKDIEQTLKRTFVLGSGSKMRNRSFSLTRQPKRLQQKKSKRQKNKDVPKSLQYEKFRQLNGMWNDYVSELLRDTDRVEDIQQKLNRVDLHGARIEVTQSNCIDFIALQGIIIKETKNTFVIVTEENVTKTIPKAESEFRIKLHEPQGIMIIAGNSFLTRPAERASKKIKSFMEFIGSKIYKTTLRYTTI